MASDFDYCKCPACGVVVDSFEVFVEWRGQCPNCGERPNPEDWETVAAPENSGSDGAQEEQEEDEIECDRCGWEGVGSEAMAFEYDGEFQCPECGHWSNT